MSQIDCYKPQNCNSLIAIHSIAPKWISWTCTMAKQLKMWRIKRKEGSASWELHVNEGWMIKMSRRSPKNVREDENMNAWGNGHTFLGVFLPILFPFLCNNYLNQILAEINGWGKRQEMGSWQFWWVLPNGSRLNIPSPYPWKIMPPSHYLLHWHS